MKSCVTISLVPEARGGPFIFWDDLAGACRKAADFGFDAIEIFAPGPEALDAIALKKVLTDHKLALAALGTGGGWVKQKLTLTSPNAEVRARARTFVDRMIDFAAPFQAAVIVGSLQGRFEGEVTREQALEYVRVSLTQLSETASARGVSLLYEHLNRYETNLLNRIEDVVPFVEQTGAAIKILADLFHMSIEESNIATAIRVAGNRIGHVHLADSNRRPAGLGHTDFEPIISALREIGYSGYLSAEALPFPDSDSAAAQTMQAFRALMQGTRA